MTTLDCSSPRSAIETASALLDVSAPHLERVLRSFEPLPDEELAAASDPFCANAEAIASAANSSLRTAHIDTALYFHGTRQISSTRIETQGLLPLAHTLDWIWDALQRIAASSGEPHHWPTFRRYVESGRCHDAFGSVLAVSSNPTLRGGPCGMLLRDELVKPPAATRDYLSSPEVVEDICRAYTSRHGFDLHSRYLDATTPFIVTFRAAANTEHLASALDYAWNHVRGNGLPAFVQSFDGCGRAVPPIDVTSVADASELR